MNSRLGKLAAHPGTSVPPFLLPAFFIAVALAAPEPKTSITRRLDRSARELCAYPAPAVAGSPLVVCSCTIVELFAGTWRKGTDSNPCPLNWVDGSALLLRPWAEDKRVQIVAWVPPDAACGEADISAQRWLSITLRQAIGVAASHGLEDFVDGANRSTGAALRFGVQTDGLRRFHLPRSRGRRRAMGGGVSARP